MAIEPSRQFKKKKSTGLDKRLEIAKIQNLESDTEKNRLAIMDSIQNMYGSGHASKT